MRRRAAEFLEEWLGENAVSPIARAPEFGDAASCGRMPEGGQGRGVAQEDIEEEVGDLSAYMSRVIADLIVRSETAPGTTRDADREQRIRIKAFYIWLDEGCPEGRAEVHWDMATELIAIEDNHALTLKPIYDGTLGDGDRRACREWRGEREPPREKATKTNSDEMARARDMLA